MPLRKAPSQLQLLEMARHGVVWLGLKLLIALSAALCLIPLLKLHGQYRLGDTTSSEAFSVARSNIPAGEYTTDRPKVAFLFLVRRDLPLDFLWDRFFKGADQRNFSIYIHSAPGIVFNEETTRSKFFYNRELKNSIKVLWGESSMIAAERLLFATALGDPSNQRFVLLSDSCIPLYNFSYTYTYLMASSKSFVDSFVDTKQKRYNMKMHPIILEKQWRKGSQWISLIRSHAQIIVNDDIVFPVFEKFCKRAIPPKTKNKWILTLGRSKKPHNCIPDEHYVQTLLMMHEREREIEHRTLTYTVWNVNVESWHPITFTSHNTDSYLLNYIKGDDHTYQGSESTIKRCRVDSNSVPCFLFARKFTIGAAMLIMKEGLIGSSPKTR